MIKGNTKINAKIIKLPLNGLNSLANYYKSSGVDDVPVILVAIYNTEQLAVEIAKALKDSAKDSSEGNNDSK
jgi:hypothetical protein